MSPRYALGLLFCALPLAAQTKSPPTLAEALLQARSPLVLADGHFSAAGAGVLTTAALQARFVLIGEDHITREIPQFAAALCNVVHPDAYAVEAGPYAARYVNNLLGRPDRLTAMAARSKAHPNNMAFLDIREENDLAAQCASASHNPHFALWGLDQEFAGSAGTLLEAMSSTQQGPLSRAAIVATQAKDRAAELDTRTTGDPGKLFLLNSSDADIKPLIDAVAADGNAATKDLLHEFTASREIYKLNAEGSPESNRIRGLLMKQHFLSDYASLQATVAAPHVVLKFGDTHLGKGLNELHQRDLGNFVAELADGEGVQSLHILVLGARGVHAHFAGYDKPLAHDPFVMTDDPDYKWLAPAVSDLITQPLGSTGSTLTLFDLRTLRFHGIDLPEDWKRIVYSYDLLVMIPELTPATPIE